MSLKTVHLFFIVVSAGLSLFMGIWAVGMYRSPLGSSGHLVATAASLIVAGLLAWYAVVFARKAQRIGLE